MICDKWLHIYGNKLGTGVNCEWVDDVVEVVRCKDCRYWQNYNDVMVCGLTNAMMSISDYCSYGERADT